MRISVIVPTVERVEALRNCLNCLLKQKYPIFEIIVVYYEKDLPTIEALKEFPSIKKVMVSRLGHARANNAGKKAATGDILSFIDDDTRPGEMWSQKIVDYFMRMPELKGLGGRDRLFFQDGRVDGPPSKDEVGVLKWYGKLVGNHHTGRGEPRSVDSLKGCFMNFRASFVSDLSFEDRLLGNASQICNDLDFSLQVKKKGGELIYDPDLEIEHHVQSRSKEDVDSRAFSYLANRNIVHNMFFSIKKNLGFFMFLRVAFYNYFWELARFHRPHWCKRNYANVWAFFVILFKKI
jgi:GT2 family glycosyltransferase